MINAIYYIKNKISISFLSISIPKLNFNVKLTLDIGDFK